jgi:uncharacterized membrane protein
VRKILETASLAGVAFLVWITWQALNGPDPLPARVPTHFDASGNPNGWGPPGTLWLLPVMAVGLYLLITVVAQFPAAFKYSVRVTEENRARLQALTLRMIAWLKIELIGLFTWIQWSILSSVREERMSLSPAIIPMFLAVVFLTTGWHIVAIVWASRGGGVVS